MFVALVPPATGPSNACRASGKSPVLKPMRHSQGTSSSIAYVRRRYGGKITLVNRRRWPSPSVPGSPNRGRATSTGPRPLWIACGGMCPLRTISQRHALTWQLPVPDPHQALLIYPPLDREGADRPWPNGGPSEAGSGRRSSPTGAAPTGSGRPVEPTRPSRRSGGCLAAAAPVDAATGPGGGAVRPEAAREPVAGAALAVRAGPWPRPSTAEAAAGPGGPREWASPLPRPNGRGAQPA